MKLKVKSMDSYASLPSRKVAGSAGLDLYCTDAVKITHQPTVINTGIAVEIPEGYVGLVMARSGLAFKHGVDILAGVIDHGYTGEIKILAISHGEDVEVSARERVAQLVIQPYLELEPEWCHAMEETERGDRGFGSTGRLDCEKGTNWKSRGYALTEMEQEDS